MNKNIKYSIIMAAYNVEQYIDESIKSVLLNHGKYELLIFNDSSTDNTLKKIERYKENKHVRIFTTNHIGLADVRNTGMKFSKGEYILFIDGDDRLSPNFLSVLDEKMKNKSDLYIFPWIAINEKSEIIGKYHYPIDFWTMDRMAWNKVYSKRLINNISFPSKVLYEDVGFTSLAFFKAESIEFLKRPVYYYRFRENSITHKAQKASLHLGIISGLKQINIWQKKYGNEDSRSEISNLNYQLIMSHVKKIFSERKYIEDNEYWVLTFLVRYLKKVNATPKRGSISNLVFLRNKLVIFLISVKHYKLADFCMSIRGGK